MATTTSQPAQLAGQKRRATNEMSNSDRNTLSNKQQRVHHETKHTQQQPHSVEPASQDPEHPTTQLSNSLNYALTAAGFNSVQPAALDMLRTHVDEFALHFLSEVRASMAACRRSIPTITDFTLAAASTSHASCASRLRPQLRVPVPKPISQPPIPDPEPEPQTTPELDHLLEPLFQPSQPSYIPPHFPKLPPQHAWKGTDVFAQRERDARKMREQATQDGKDAENALRKLAAAAKQGVMKAERKERDERRRSSLPLVEMRRVMDGRVGVGKVVGGRDRGKGKVREKREEVLAGLLGEFGDGEDAGVDGEVVGDDGMDAVKVGLSKGLVVNHDGGHWRKGGGTRHGLMI